MNFPITLSKRSMFIFTTIEPSARFGFCFARFGCVFKYVENFPGSKSKGSLSMSKVSKFRQPSLVNVAIVLIESKKKQAFSYMVLFSRSH